jgi:tetratricopeptide (TPR) repeat protein
MDRPPAVNLFYLSNRERSIAPMPDEPASPGKNAPPWAAPRRQLILAVAIIALAAIAAYANSFRVPFVFDDDPSVTGNPSIRDLGQLGTVLTPMGVTIGGRPLVNLSLAFNYAWTGKATWSYHAFNLAIHVLAALALFGVLRRTLLAASPAGDLRESALPLSALGALLWAVHPLQTAAVTYISQRAEAMMALFYLLTLYGFIRSTASARPTPWLGLSVLCCFAGMATKEVMVTAPALVLLYDRIFHSPSFRAAFRQHWLYYAALASSWLPLAYFMVSSRLGDRSVGFNAGVDALSYALTESKVIVLYLKLAVWPDPLVFDYGREMLVREPLAAAPYALLVLAALAGTGFLFARGRKALGFIAAAFFILLSPTSSFVPIVDQPMAESRMYLPLAAVITLAVLGLHRAFGRRAWYGLAALAVLLCALSLDRNYDYRSPVSIWGDTVAKHPETSRGQYNLANELAPFPERKAARVAHYEAAIRLRPDDAAAHNNLANTLAGMPGRLPEAIAHCEAALRLKPAMTEAHNNLANYLARIPGRLPEAIAHYEQALRLKPGYAEAHFNLANALATIPGRMPDAIAHYEAAVRFKPDLAVAQQSLAEALAKIPARAPEAIAHFETALKLNPALVEAHLGLANELGKDPSRLAGAAAHYEAYLLVKPDQPDVHYNLANKLAQLPGRAPDAIRHYEAALRLRPGFAEAHNNLAIALAKIPARESEAIQHYEEAIHLKPDFADAHYNLAGALARIPSRLPAALVHYETVLRLRPKLAEAHCAYARLLALQPGRMPEAMDHYETALRLQPGDAAAHNSYAVALARSGLKAAAVSHLELALKLKPDYAEARANLAKLRAGQLP